MRRSIHVASWAGWLLLLTPSLNAQSLRPEAAIALQNELRRIVRESSPSEALGVAVSDAVTGQDIFSHNAHIHRNPASNMKLVTAAGVLKHLGPNFKIRTALYGRMDDSGNVDVLVLRGQGDPSLSMSDFTELAAQIRYRGVRRVRKVIVDGSYFDDQRLPPAFEQQPNEVSAFRAPVAAVTLERSSFLLRVRPSLSAGDTAVATLVPSGYFDVENQITTTASGSPNIIAIQRDAGRQLSLKLRGSIPISSTRGVAYRRRVANPLSYAAFGMVEALQRVGIRTDRLVETRKVDDPLPMLASRQSPSVATLLQRVGKLSDNFYAEMLLKVMAAEHAAPGTSKHGAQLLEQMLSEVGAPGEATIINGSGLFEGNAITPAQLTHLLHHVYRSPSIRHEYLSHLSIAGVDGTLRRRMRDTAAQDTIRAKTGTLNGVITLSGYAVSNHRVFSFSVLCNGVRGKHAQARRFTDEIATALAIHVQR